MKFNFTFAALALSGCLSTTSPDSAANTRNAKLNATASFVAQKTAEVAFDVVLSAAVSHSDAVAKGNYLDGLASAFRGQEGSLITSNDVKSLVSIWTPYAPHWAVLGSQIADTYAQANPKTPKEASVILESIASALNDSASIATL